MSYLTLPNDYWPVRASYPPNSIFVFDFDGVLIHQNEEKLYRLNEIEGERSRLEDLARLTGIDPTLYSTPYLRHLVFQARYDGPCRPHVLTEFARSLAEPYFVLTARSGFHAVQRMVSYLDVMDLNPQEVFCVGRGPKSILLAKLLDQWPDRTIVFFDDSMKHIDDACSLNHDRLIVTFVDWSACEVEARELRKKLLMDPALFRKLYMCEFTSEDRR